MNDPTHMIVPPPPPAPRPSLAQRFQRLPLIGKLGCGCLSLVLLIVCIAFSAGAISGIVNGSPTPTPAPIAQATAIATSTPGPTATPTPSGPHILTGATLGGLPDAFQAKYGAPTGTGTAKSYTFTINGKSGNVTATPLSATSSDGKEHIASLRIGPPGATWTADTAQPICEAFLPPDAVFVKTQNVPDYGPERVYTSADLALSFNAGEFNGAAPGTFAMELWPGKALNTGCIIILGA
jgi:hypothetical protein